MQAGFNYAPKPQQQSVVLFRSTDRMSLVMTQVDKYSQWDAITCGGLREIVVPGSHDQVLQPSAVSVVAAEIRDMLPPDSNRESPKKRSSLKSIVDSVLRKGLRRVVRTMPPLMSDVTGNQKIRL